MLFSAGELNNPPFQVFRILENPEGRFKEQTDFKLSDMYREGCFAAAYPLHSGNYKIGERQKWSDINIGTLQSVLCCYFEMYQLVNHLVL